MGMKINVMSVPTKSPPIMVTANEPNMASGTNGTMPRMVVRLAIMTGNRRDFELRIKAFLGVTPFAISKLISSIKTMPFFIIMPINPNTPTMATKPNCLPLRRTNGMTPITTK